MDENKFDKAIKDKISDFDAVDFDPSALEALHYKMDASIPQSWFVRNRSELAVAAGMSVLAFLLWFGQWKYGNNEIESLKRELESSKNQSQQLVALQNQMDELSASLSKTSNGSADTVTVVKYINRPNGDYLLLQNQIAALRNELKAVQGTKTANNKLIFIGKESELTTDIVAELMDNGSLVKNGGLVFFSPNDNLEEWSGPNSLPSKGYYFTKLVPRYNIYIDSVYSDEENIIEYEKDIPVQISLSKKKELEKHYYKGIGIELGPTSSVYAGRFASGSFVNGIGAGLASNFVLSPTVSLASDVSFNSLHYGVDNSDLTKINSTNSHPEYGAINQMEITSWFFEIPLELRYRYRINQKNHFLFGLGLSSYLYTSQKLEYKYVYNVDNTLALPIEKAEYVKELNYYLGSADISAGLKFGLKENRSLETSLFYKKGIGKVGVEQNEVDFFGVKASYLFTVR